MNEPSERESNDALTRLVERLRGMLESVIKERAELLVRVENITHEATRHLDLYAGMTTQRDALADEVASLRSALDIERVNADSLTRERDAAEDLSCDIRTVNADESAVLNRCDRDRLFLAREVLKVEGELDWAKAKVMELVASLHYSVGQSEELAGQRDELAEAARRCRERR